MNNIDSFDFENAINFLDIKNITSINLSAPKTELTKINSIVEVERHQSKISADNKTLSHKPNITTDYFKDAYEKRIRFYENKNINNK